MNCQVMGKEVRDYTDKTTGERKQYRAVHVVWDAAKGKDGLVGRMVETVSVPREVDLDKIQVGQLYQVVYGAYGRYARVEDFVLMKP